MNDHDDNTAPPDEPPAPTDFHSLMSTPDYDVAAAAQAERDAKKVVTDFHELKKELPDDRFRYQHKTITDWLVDVMTPLLVFAMVFCVIFFLLDVRFVYTAIADLRLRIVAFCLIMGIVALNRLVARDGSDESLLYIVLLVGVTGLFTLALSLEGSTIAKGLFSHPLAETGLNMAIVVALWWSTNRLVHECCVDENPEAGDVGILTGTVRNVREAIRERGPKRERVKKDEVFAKMEIEAVDPLDWKEPEKVRRKPVSMTDASQRLRKRHPGMSIFYYSVPAFLVFAFGLPVIMQGGRPFIVWGHVYVGGFTLAALCLLMLTSLAGVRAYFRERRVRLPALIGPFWIGLGLFMVAMVMFGATALPMPAMPQMAYVAEHEMDYWSRGRELDLQDPGLTADEIIRQNRYVTVIGRAVIAALAIILVYGTLRAVGAVAAEVGRRRSYYPRFLVRAFDTLDRGLQRALKVPLIPKSKPRIRVDPAVAQSTQYRNPMKGEGPGSGADVNAYITHAYDALCALAADLGAPRETGQTPYEFIRAWPRTMRPIRNEALELTELYVQASYSQVKLDENVLDRLRKFWIEYERLRRRYVR